MFYDEAATNGEIGVHITGVSSGSIYVITTSSVRRYRVRSIDR